MKKRKFELELRFVDMAGETRGALTSSMTSDSVPRVGERLRGLSLHNLEGPSEVVVPYAGPGTVQMTVPTSLLEFPWEAVVVDVAHGVMFQDLPDFAGVGTTTTVAIAMPDPGIERRRQIRDSRQTLWYTGNCVPEDLDDDEPEFYLEDSF